MSIKSDIVQQAKETRPAEDVVTRVNEDNTNHLINTPLNVKIHLGYSMNISLSHTEFELLENIKQNLNGLGTIYVYPDRKEARLAI
jgi:hypothetical protein